MVALKNDIVKVKKINIELIKSTLKEFGSATKGQIANATGISFSTCGKILNELCQQGEVLEDSMVTQDGYGRPAKSYIFNGNFAYVACIYVSSDFGKVSISVQVSNLLGEAVESHTREIDSVTQDLLENTIVQLLEHYPKLRVVSIGIPGNLVNGVIGLCNFVALMGLALQDILQQRFPEIKILVENDMNATAYGFYLENHSGQDTTLAFIYSPSNVLTGFEKKRDPVPDTPMSPEEKLLLNTSIHIGAGFVSSGRILRGFSGFSGEISFLPSIRRNGDSLQVSAELMTEIVGAIVPTINPEIIVLTGENFDQNTVDEIQNRCMEFILPPHMPQIILKNNIHDDYIGGLTSLALEQISCGVMLVEKKI